MILVTAFQPFGGSKVNLSKSVALELKKKLPNVEICELPVVYDQAADAAIACFEKLKTKPSLVLGLGEGSCALRLETSAENLDNTPKFPDNGGNVRTSTPIMAGGPEKVSFSLPTEAMYCSLDKEDRAAITPSKSAGNYVCNNTAYRLSRYFSERQIPYGFIHVPHSKCDEKLRDPQKNAELISKMLAAASSQNVTSSCSQEFTARLNNPTKSKK